jgi:hypothetical protein
VSRSNASYSVKPCRANSSSLTIGKRGMQVNGSNGGVACAAVRMAFLRRASSRLIVEGDVGVPLSVFSFPRASRYAQTAAPGRHPSLAKGRESFPVEKAQGRAAAAPAMAEAAAVSAPVFDCQGISASGRERIEAARGGRRPAPHAAVRSLDRRGTVPLVPSRSLTRAQ